jgi:Tfp pilus assembly protein PilF
MRELHRPSIRGGLMLLGLGLMVFLLAGCGAGSSLGDSFTAQRAYDAGLGRYTAKDYPGAAADFARAVRMDSTHDDARAYLAWSHYRQGDYVSATREFRTALARQPQWAGLHNGLGWSRYRVERYHLALKAFGDALALDPQYRDAAVGQAYSLYALERYDEARPLLERLVREGEGGGFQTPLSDVDEVRARYAWTLYYLGDYAAARAQFAKAAAAHLDWAGLHNGLGWSSLRLGDRAAAAESFRHALSLRADFEDAREGMVLAKSSAAP